MTTCIGIIFVNVIPRSAAHPGQPPTPIRFRRVQIFEAIQINQNNRFLLDLAITACRAVSSSMPYNKAIRTPWWRAF
jgi:hypothetical protein